MKAENLIRPDIATMEPYTPIYPFDVLAERLGCDPDELIKLDANENPYGPSPRVKEALANLDAIHIYPDPESRRLRRALEDFTQVPREQILAGAGADELIDLTMRLFLEPGDAIINCPPTFGMYPFDAAINGAEVVSVPRRDDFSVDTEAVVQAVDTHRPKLVFLASPNNPNGSWLPNEDLEALLALPVVIVLDEAYVEFAGRERSRIRQVPERDNLIVLRTFSKLAGLAGLRVGYGAFPRDLMPHLWKIKQPYNVSVAAYTAAGAALDDLEWLEDKIDLLVKERKRLWEELDAIGYLAPYPTESNFILCRVLGRDAGELKRQLEQKRILIRYFNKPGLDDHVRFSIGRPEEMDVLIETLKGL